MDFLSLIKRSKNSIGNVRASTALHISFWTYWMVCRTILKYDFYFASDFLFKKRLFIYHCFEGSGGLSIYAFGQRAVSARCP